MKHSGQMIGENWRITPGGGTAYYGTNATGADSVRGMVVIVGPADGAVIMPSSDTHPGGIVFESGISDGERMWINTQGPAWVLLEDGTGANRGDWLMTSSVAGRAVAHPKPTALGIPELYEHQRQIGYALIPASSGTNVLCATFLKLI